MTNEMIFIISYFGFGFLCMICFGTRDYLVNHRKSEIR